jgi:hypothetical protein
LSNAVAAKVINRKKWLILGSFRMFPFKLHSNDIHVICPKNKPFFAETLKAEKQWRSHQSGIGEADVFSLSFALLLACMFANYL